MKIKIRKYQPSDYQACRNLFSELKKHHRDIYSDQTIGRKDPGEGIDLYLENKRLHGPWVAIFNEEVIGLIGLLKNDEEAIIEPVIVSSEYRNQGVGKLIIEHLVKEANKIDVRF
ncbi:MAG: GNAT family N-acetyltransferase [Halobacteriota archaeon]|nr:GNAT family N-acetyltransferase [Halobacteriota archaeon]